MSTEQQILQAVRKVKNKYEKKWLVIPQVQAVGIGRLQNGQLGIIISVKKISPGLQRQIPFQIHGVPIELKESRTFEAL